MKMNKKWKLFQKSMKGLKDLLDLVAEVQELKKQKEAKRRETEQQGLESNEASSATQACEIQNQILVNSENQEVVLNQESRLEVIAQHEENNRISGFSLWALLITTFISGFLAGFLTRDVIGSSDEIMEMPDSGRRRDSIADILPPPIAAIVERKLGPIKIPVGLLNIPRLILKSDEENSGDGPSSPNVRFRTK